MCKVSFIIPVYNGRQFLSALFATLEGQTASGSWEAVVVDDSSTDDSWAILQQKAREDGRYRVFQKPNGRYANRGVAYALKRMRGEWFYYLSQDDQLSPDLLEQMLAAAERGGDDIDAVIPRMETWSGSKSTQFAMSHSPGETIAGEDAFIESINWGVHGFILFNRRLLGCFEPHTGLVNSDELDTRRYLYHSRRVAFSEGTFRYHVGNSDAITVRWNVDRTGFLESCRLLWQFAEEKQILGRAASEIRRLTLGLSLNLLARFIAARRSGQTAVDDRRRVFEAIERVRPICESQGGDLVARLILRAPLGQEASLLAFRVYSKIKSLGRR